MHAVDHPCILHTNKTEPKDQQKTNTKQQHKGNRNLETVKKSSEHLMDKTNYYSDGVTDSNKNFVSISVNTDI